MITRASRPAPSRGPGLPVRVVPVPQGGGAPGAYRVGVGETLREAGTDPDRVIGAIDAALTAGNERADHADRLDAFRRRIEGAPGDPMARLASWGRGPTTPVAPRRDAEDHAKDGDFTADGIRARREPGRADRMRMIERAPWDAPTDPMEGMIEHAAPV